MMYSKQNFYMVLLAFLGISMAIAGERNAWAHQQNNLNLMSFMSRSNSIMQRDPSRSLECFDYYIPLINSVAEKYQNDFNACLKTSDEDHAAADAATLDKRNDLASKASTSCDVLSSCSDKESTELVFECFVNGGSENVKSMYAINSEASEHLAEFQEKLRLIKNDEFKCTNETKRTYERDSTIAYDDFNSCVLGLSEPPKPTTTPATSTPAPTTTSSEGTEAPTETTSTESVETTPEVAPEDKLPEEDVGDMLRQALKSRLQHFRV